MLTTSNKNKQSLRFGVIGCSRISQKSVLPAMLESRFAELVMIGSRSKEKAAAFAEQFHSASYGNYEDVLRNKNVEAVYISLPIALHEKWVMKATKAKKHVLCEKPAATTFSSAKKMVGAARKNKVRLMEGLMFRYHPQHAKVKELIKRGVFGELLKFDGCLAVPMPDKNNSILQASLGGGYYNDAAPYPIYASRMIFGEEPISVACHLVIDRRRKIDTKSDMLLEFPDGKSAFISTAIGSYYQSTYSVLGSKAYAKVARAYAVPKNWTTKIYLEKNDKTTEIKIEPADHFKLMIDDFSKEILRGDASAKDYEDDLLAQARILEAGRVSHREKRIVYLREFK